MRAPNVTVYGSRSCPDTQRATGCLDSSKVAYEFKDVDASPEYDEYLAALNGGKRILPTIRINNMTLINPDDKALTQAVEDAAVA